MTRLKTSRPRSSVPIGAAQHVRRDVVARQGHEDEHDASDDARGGQSQGDLTGKSVHLN